MLYIYISINIHTSSIQEPETKKNASGIGGASRVPGAWSGSKPNWGELNIAYTMDWGSCGVAMVMARFFEPQFLVVAMVLISPSLDSPLIHWLPSGNLT